MVKGRANPKSKGAGSIAGVDPEVKAALERGEVASRTLSETLAIDFDRLLAAVGLPGPPLLATGVVKRMHEAASRLPTWAPWAEHPSDTVRGWAAFRMASDAGLDVTTALREIRRFAADTHFGVREWAWLAVRGHITRELDAAITLLRPWTSDADANVRRFASEATRPRGVWCAHLRALVDDPARGLPLLEPLRDDASKYVGDSVGNWLNDAGKSQPRWLQEITVRWLRESPTDRTQAIVRRARRSLG